MTVKGKTARGRTLLGVSFAALGMALAGVAHADPRTFNVPAEDAVEAIPEFARQAGVQIVAPADRLRGVQTPAVQGTMEPRDALALLLEGTGLEVASDDGRVITLRAVTEGQAGSPTQLGAAAGASSDANTAAEILVIGSSTLNADIRRTEDDFQPYVVLDGEDIRRSGAVNLEDYLQSRLPMNAQSSTVTRDSLTSVGVVNGGRINLRGLGVDETVVLVDGRRLPSVSLDGDSGQPNITGISPAMIERIEVLPSTASGQYGGSATGGVINIILKRDYSGLDVVVGYGNTFDSDASTRDLALNWGGSFDNGHTRIALSAAFTEATELLNRDRDFLANGVRLQRANDPSQLGFGFSAGRNVCSTMFGFACDGAPLTLDDGTPLNSVLTFIPAGYAGPASDDGQALLDNAGQVDLANDPFPIWSAPSSRSFGLSVRRDFNDWLEGFVDYSRNEVRGPSNTFSVVPLTVPGASPYNPFQQDIRVNLLLGDLGFGSSGTAINEATTAGLIVRLPRSWSAALEYREATLERPFGENGSLISSATRAALRVVALQDLVAHPVDGLADLFVHTSTGTGDRPSGVETYSLRLSGPVLTLPGGPLTATALLERNHAYLAKSTGMSDFGGAIPNQYFLTPPAERDRTSQYLELQAPLVSHENNIPWVHTLDLMASVRHDVYESLLAIGTGELLDPFDPNQTYELGESELESTNYTIGFRYAPVEDITFRASYGTGFLPPNMSQLYESPLMPTPVWYFDPFFDPLRGGEEVLGDIDGNILMSGGGGRTDIRPEESTSLSYGFIFTPRFLDGLRISVDVTEIEKTDEIGYISPDYILAHESDFPGRVIRGPNLVDDEPGWAGPITAIDDSIINTGRSEMRAIDIQADYSFETENWGEWRVFAVATKSETLTQDILPGQPGPEMVGTFDGTPEWRANFGAEWTYGPWWLGWNAQYVNSYGVCRSLDNEFQCDLAQLSQGSDEIPSQVYHDLRVSYQLTGDDSRFSNTQLSFGIQNVFDESPPLLATSLAYNGFSPYGDPRLRRFSLQLRTHF